MPHWCEPAARCQKKGSAKSIWDRGVVLMSSYNSQSGDVSLLLAALVPGTLARRAQWDPHPRSIRFAIEKKVDRRQIGRSAPMTG